MTNYIEVNEFKSRIGVQDSKKNTRILEHITAASRRVDAICHRQFGPHAGVATVRYFNAAGCGLVFIDDAYEISAVATDDGNTGSYTTTWAATDYETDPANGVGVDGQAGWPATTLRSFGTRVFPTWMSRRAVKVTAKWGWAAIPDAVTEATYLLANRLYYEVAVPGGAAPANFDAGLPGAPLQRPYTAENLLRPYARAERVIGVAG